jgi:hypothetical protein
MFQYDILILDVHKCIISQLNAYLTFLEKNMSRFCVNIDGVWLVIAYNDHLQLKTTSKYSVIATLRTLQIKCTGLWR